MDLVDITLWDSEEIRSILVSQVFILAPYDLKVRRFVPMPGDMLEEIWMANGVERRFPLPPYAIVNMAEAADAIEHMVSCNRAQYLDALLKPRFQDPMYELLRDTYSFADGYSRQTRDIKTKSLLQDTFSLWIACRLTSHPEAIVGLDTLGLTKKAMDDGFSPWKNQYPIPPVMSAQLECILYTKLLRPLSAKVRTSLDELFKKKSHDIWLEAYLAIFVLLHSCALLIKRDEEYARQINLITKYANPESIKEHQKGAITLLAHFHRILHGPIPLRRAHQGDLQSFKKNWDFTPGQEQFMKRTYSTVLKMRESLQKPEGEARACANFGLVPTSRSGSFFSSVRAARNLSNEFYWISQLYEEDWVPDKMD
ncbi:uncharacterized protein DNG_00890 [Cephalotrichum gorgonifer]|uniref:Uncharacterized protein n=1 Tax=Cephalotrichum gorgonifer TaxID=2041049 RepID=A0AAE8SR55_9PEZI|nr:uncharacterized protein DNG_00890 [Cephalotrichum gorgonifer]